MKKVSNLFDVSEYPKVEPEVLYVGDFWRWKRALTDYPVGSYALTYNFRLDASTAFAITASESSDPNEYRVEVASATTASYTKGLYYWSAFITKTASSERIQIYNGRTEIRANRAVLAEDPRTDAQKNLDAIEAVINNRASIDQQAMSIAGRSLTRMSPEELYGWRNRFKQQVHQELVKQRIANGQSTGNTVKVRFT